MDQELAQLESSVPIKYLDKEVITRINYLTIKDVGGNFVPPMNFLNEGNLDYLVEAVQAEMFGEPLYPGVRRKAGLYFHNIICNHIFQDGNKRTGLEAALLFLQLNGYDLVVEDDLLIDFTLSVASADISQGRVLDWFEINVTKLPE